MKKISTAAVSLAFILALASPAFPAAIAATAPAAPAPMPPVIDPAAKYLLFHHNYYVEAKGADGECKYGDILKSFRDRGFVVISELRPKDASVIEYGGKGADAVRKLVAAGVPPENITVAGHSKGGAIVLQVAARLDNPKINYLVLAGCGIKGLEKGYPPLSGLKGRFFSLYAATDRIAGSCRQAASGAGNALPGDELVLESGAGHQLFFKPDALWVEPAVAWLKKES
jgi:hypothetical protein